MNRRDRALIIIMVKAPISGRVKTRLAESIGEGAAVDLYISFVEDILEKTSTCCCDTAIGVFPGNQLQMVREWLGNDREYLLQKGRDIGERQTSLLEQGFDRGHGRCILMSSDCPDLPGMYIDDAVKALDGIGSILGPAEDGGYYLIGLRKEEFRKELLISMDWSHPDVLKDTLERLDDLEISTGLLPPWWDVDDINDLRDLRRRLEGNMSAPMTGKAIGRIKEI